MANFHQIICRFLSDNFANLLLEISSSYNFQYGYSILELYEEAQFSFLPEAESLCQLGHGLAGFARRRMYT